MTLEIKTGYAFDEEGFYSHDVDYQVGEGIYLPDDCTATKPPFESAAENFLQWDGEKWNLVPKPKTAADFVGLTVKHDSNTPHDLELKKLMVPLAQGSADYRLDRSDVSVWRVVPVEDVELEAREAEQDLRDFDSQLEDLKDRMSLAMLMDDEETIAELRAEYKKLMEGGE